LFSWLGDKAHQIITAIGGFFDWLGTHIHDIVGKIGDLFSGLGTIMHDVVGKIGDAFSWLGTQAHDVAGKVGDAFSGLGTAVKGVMDGLNNAVSGAWQNISQSLSQLAGKFNDWFGGLANQAFQWGANLITQLIAGIGSMFSALGSKANDAAQVIAKFLGFHSPTEEGPGSTAHLWMPALVNMLAQGLTQGVPQIRSASMLLASGIASAFAANNSTFASPSAFAVQSGAFAVPGALGAGSNQQGTMNVSVQLDSKTLLSAYNVAQAKEVRIAGYRHA